MARLEQIVIVNVDIVQKMWRVILWTGVATTAVHWAIQEIFAT